MLYTEILPDFNKPKHISDIKKGDILVNLGTVLESEPGERFYTLIISRLNEKQVMKFDKEIYLVTM